MKKFHRILLKLSGESLMGQQGYGIDVQRLKEYAQQIKEIADMGVQIGIVIGGGNIFRGLSGAGKGFDRVKGDQMGMCATVINSLALSSAEPRAHRHPYGAYRRILQQVEGYRGYGAGSSGDYEWRHRQSLLHH